MNQEKYYEVKASGRDSVFRETAISCTIEAFNTLDALEKLMEFFWVWPDDPTDVQIRLTSTPLENLF